MKDSAEFKLSPQKADSGATSMLTSRDIRERFLQFFEKRGHTIIPSASLVTPDEKGVTDATLFNTAGMQPLIPYLLGKPYLAGNPLKSVKCLADSQKCLRTIDIDEIGDKTHATFFEMLGNWSLGDYFKREAIEWSYEFLTSKSETKGDRGLGLDPRRLYVTVFEGDENASRDEEAADIWRGIFKKHCIEGERIFYMPASMNWWEAGDNGPCGPDTEMYYDVGDPATGKSHFGGRGLTRDEFLKADSERHIVEVWNDVFMQYEKRGGKIIGNLPAPSVDTGAGLERLTMTLQGVDNIYDTDLFKPVMEKIREFSKNWDLKSARIVADHTRSSVFLIADGVVPSNTGRGYILRRLLRRAIGCAADLEFKNKSLTELVGIIVDKYGEVYKNILSQKTVVIENIKDEEQAFLKTIDNGKKELIKLVINTVEKNEAITGSALFFIFSTHGIPLETSFDFIDNIIIHELSFSPLQKDKYDKTEIRNVFEREMKKHQSLSRAGAEQKFKGGLADANDPMVLRYHTATHLLHQALHDVLGEDAGGQKGSNITPERLRFDFAYGAKMTDEQKKRVEQIVNEKIAAALPMRNIVMPRAEAEKTGARHFFGEKYSDEISIYYIGGGNSGTAADLKTAYSKEFCGGPHVTNTRELAGPEGKWRFKIQKEEAVSQGVRRIKAVLA